MNLAELVFLLFLFYFIIIIIIFYMKEQTIVCESTPFGTVLHSIVLSVQRAGFWNLILFGEQRSQLCFGINYSGKSKFYQPRR